MCLCLCKLLCLCVCVSMQKKIPASACMCVYLQRFEFSKYLISNYFSFYFLCNIQDTQFILFFTHVCVRGYIYIYMSPPLLKSILLTHIPLERLFFCIICNKISKTFFFFFFSAKKYFLEIMLTSSAIVSPFLGILYERRGASYINKGLSGVYRIDL